MKHQNPFTFNLLSILGLNQTSRSRFRPCRLAILGLLATFFILASVSEARAQVFTTNQKLVAGLPPTTIPLDYDWTSNSLVGPVSLGVPVQIVYSIQVTSN